MVKRDFFNKTKIGVKASKVGQVKKLFSSRLLVRCPLTGVQRF